MGSMALEGVYFFALFLTIESHSNSASLSAHNCYRSSNYNELMPSGWCADRWI